MHYNELIPILQNLIERQVTQKELMGILGIKSPTTMSGRANRNSKFSTEEIRKIGKYFNVDIFNNKKELRNLSSDEVEAFYYPDVFGSCGSGSFVLSETKEKTLIPRLYFSSYSKVKKYSVINARGDSMTPSIQNMDRLIVEHWDGEQIWDNSVYVFRFGDEIFVKRLVKNIDQVIIKSDNVLYPIRIVEGEKLNDLEIIGQIVGLMRDMKL